MNSPLHFRSGLLLVASSLAIFLSGCASYVTPRGRANLDAISSPTMRESFAAKPEAGFPAGIAVVRVQAPGYRSYYTDREGGVYGNGKYSVVITREVEDEADLKRISRLPNVHGIISISPLLLSQKLQTDADLREAAAKLKADMLLIYTFHTTFHKDEGSAGLTTISLGWAKSRHITVRVNASALLMDTRTGFIYNALDANEKRELDSNVWSTRESADHARQEAEQAAFKQLAKQFEKSWAQVVDRAKKGA